MKLGIDGAGKPKSFQLITTAIIATKLDKILTFFQTDPVLSVLPIIITATFHCLVPPDVGAVLMQASR